MKKNAVSDNVLFSCNIPLIIPILYVLFLIILWSIVFFNGVNNLLVWIFLIIATYSAFNYFIGHPNISVIEQGMIIKIYTASMFIGWDVLTAHQRIVGVKIKVDRQSAWYTGFGQRVLFGGPFYILRYRKNYQKLCLKLQEELQERYSESI